MHAGPIYYRRDTLFSPAAPPDPVIHSGPASVNSVKRRGMSPAANCHRHHRGKKRKESHGIISWRDEPGQGGVMAKRYGRPSAQYRYEHYDPTPWGNAV